MIAVNDTKKWLHNTFELDKKSILLSSEVITYKLSKEDMEKEFNKYNNKLIK